MQKANLDEKTLTTMSSYSYVILLFYAASGTRNFAGVTKPVIIIIAASSQHMLQHSHLSKQFMKKSLSFLFSLN